MRKEVKEFLESKISKVTFRPYSKKSIEVYGSGIETLLADKEYKEKRNKSIVEKLYKEFLSKQNYDKEYLLREIIESSEHVYVKKDYNKRKYCIKILFKKNYDWGDNINAIKINAISELYVSDKINIIVFMKKYNIKSFLYKRKDNRLELRNLGYCDEEEYRGDYDKIFEQYYNDFINDKIIATIQDSD